MKSMTKRQMKRAIRAGALTGARSISAVAAIARKEHHPLARWLLTAAAIEIVADKLPFMPSRLRPSSLAGRALLGGVSGALVSGARFFPVAAISAVAAAYGLNRFRVHVKERLGMPDFVGGFLEDAVVARGARSL